jgi:hypothetical protein
VRGPRAGKRHRVERRFLAHELHLLPCGALGQVSEGGVPLLFGEHSLRRALSESVEHFHAERHHQGKGNVLLFPRDTGIRRAMFRRATRPLALGQVFTNPHSTIHEYPSVEPAGEAD